MLVIKRRAGEAIRLGDDIEVRILAVTQSRVTIGVEAPRQIAIRRSELATIEAENLAAAAAAETGLAADWSELAKLLRVRAQKSSQTS
jgi:carbon storage regulator